MGTLSLAAPLVLFEKSMLWAGTGFHLLPSFHHHPTQHNNTTQTVTHTVTLTSTSYTVHYTDTHPTRNVVCPSGAWFENRPHLTPSIRLAWNPKHIIVQWVGIEPYNPNAFGSDASSWRYILWNRTLDKSTQAGLLESVVSRMSGPWPETT